MHTHNRKTKIKEKNIADTRDRTWDLYQKHGWVHMDSLRITQISCGAKQEKYL